MIFLQEAFGKPWSKSEIFHFYLEFSVISHQFKWDLFLTCYNFQTLCVDLPFLLITVVAEHLFSKLQTSF
jgi:hypothetical protein